MFQKVSNNRYPLQNVALVISGASFSLLLFNYLSKFIGDEPFNWTAYLEYFPNHLIGTIFTIVLAWFLINYFHMLFSNRRPLSAYIFPLVVATIIIQLYNLCMDAFMPLSSNINDPISVPKQVLGNFIVALLFLGFFLILAYVTHLRDEKKKGEKIEKERLKLEVQKVDADLKFLKSQVNPHFLHNTLNSFYARSLPLSKDLAESILTLSKMMRYALGETHNPDGKVLLRDEIEHVQHLISIHQFRFRNNLQVQLHVTGELDGKLIIPFVLITLVENIFKHADLSDPAFPVMIHIDVSNGGLEYQSHNKKNEGSKELSTGIGLDNIRKRLSLCYKDQFDLEIKENDTDYFTRLRIGKL